MKKNGLLIKEKIEQIKREITDYGLSENKRTHLLLRVSSGFVKAKGSKGTILGEMLADIGLVNIADNDKNLLENISIESIIRENPYRIFVVAMGDDVKKATDNLNKIIKENPAWQGLDAIKENRLHIMDKRRFNIKPNEKWAESYEELKGILLEK